MCINMQAIDKKWDENMEKDGDTQKKAMRKWNE